MKAQKNVRYTSDEARKLEIPYGFRLANVAEPGHAPVWMLREVQKSRFSLAPAY